jgi:hypothetical protein
MKVLLEISSDEPIPDDVLVEHVAHHLRADFSETHGLNVKHLGKSEWLMSTTYKSEDNA